jgi:hypothetical protein
MQPRLSDLPPCPHHRARTITDITINPVDITITRSSAALQVIGEARRGRAQHDGPSSPTGATLCPSFYP